MIFIYEKGSNKFVGLATRVFDNGTMREPSLEELYPDRDTSKLGYVYVNDSIKYALDPTAWEFKLNEQGEPVGVIRKTGLARIHLSTDAIDADGDGYPELLADGKSKATITVNLRYANGKAIKGEQEVFFRTTGGILSRRRVQTKNGKAQITLRSVEETITIQVSAIVKNLETAQLTFELMPVVD